jgi:hypothetical protein
VGCAYGAGALRGRAYCYCRYCCRCLRYGLGVELGDYQFQRSDHEVELQAKAKLDDSCDRRFRAVMEMCIKAESGSTVCRLGCHIPAVQLSDSEYPPPIADLHWIRIQSIENCESFPPILPEAVTRCKDQRIENSRPNMMPAFFAARLNIRMTDLSPTVKARATSNQTRPPAHNPYNDLSIPDRCATYG